MSNLYSYFGNAPFTGAPLDKPEVKKLEDDFWGRYNNDMVTENWMAFVNDELWGMAVYTPICTNFLAGMAGDAGMEAEDAGTSYIAPIKDAALGKNDVYEYEYYIIIGHIDELRARIYAINAENKDH